VWLYNKENVQVHDNIIIPSNGRGVLLNSGKDIEILRNVILFLDQPNVEFGDNLNACAVRARYSLVNNVITDNIGLGIAGTDLTGCSALYLTNQKEGVSRYERNHLTTIVRGTGSIKNKKYAKVISMEGHGITYPNVDTIAGNICRSNHMQVSTGGYDGVCGGQTISNCDFSWVDGNTAAADFIQALNAKLTEIGLQNNETAKSIVAECINQVNTLLKDEIIRPERAFWNTKYWSGNEKCLIENSRFHNTDPATFHAHAGFYEGEVLLEVAGLLKITKPPEPNSQFTLTMLEPDPEPTPADCSEVEAELVVLKKKVDELQGLVDTLTANYAKLEEALLSERIAHSLSKNMIDELTVSLESLSQQLQEKQVKIDSIKSAIQTIVNFN
jgi:hypothetical protein